MGQPRQAAQAGRQAVPQQRSAGRTPPPSSGALHHCRALGLAGTPWSGPAGGTAVGASYALGTVGTLRAALLSAQQHPAAHSCVESTLQGRGLLCSQVVATADDAAAALRPNPSRRPAALPPPRPEACPPSGPHEDHRHRHGHGCDREAASATVGVKLGCGARGGVDGGPTAARGVPSYAQLVGRFIWHRCTQRGVAWLDRHPLE